MVRCWVGWQEVLIGLGVDADGAASPLCQYDSQVVRSKRDL